MKQTQVLDLMWSILRDRLKGNQADPVAWLVREELTPSEVVDLFTILNNELFSLTDDTYLYHC